MDLRHMRHFVAVVEERHFGRAAERLNMAQPPLSQSIRRLELDLGVDLLDRSRRGVELTPSGRVFFEEARRTLLQADLACKMACRAAEQAVEVRVSFVGPALYRILPSLLVQFREDNPAVVVKLHERASPQQVEGIAAGEFDVGFVTAGTEYIEGCESMVIERAPFVAAIPSDWPLARQASVTLGELAEQPFILPPQKYAAQTSDVLTMFKSVGEMPHVAQEATQTNTTLSLVGVGLGCSIVTETAALFQPRNVTMLPISDQPPHRRWELLMVWAPDRIEPAAAAFLESARRASAAHPEWTEAAR